MVLLLPAMSLAFVGLIQGAAVSAGVPNRDGLPSDVRQDFVGQGVGNVAAGLFQGMPVGGSMSASALAVTAGARSRLALLVASVVMAVTILMLADVVGHVAMPALAALLIVVGIGSIKPSQVVSVVRTGSVQTAIMLVTLTLTMIVPLQYSVLIGVGLAILMYVTQQSNRVQVRRLLVLENGRIRELDPPATLPENEVVVLQAYGSLFFASGPLFEAQLPATGSGRSASIVILRLRGVDQLGLSLIDRLRRYTEQLQAAGASLKLVLSSERILHQLESEGLADLVGTENLYLGGEWLGETVRSAYDDARRELGLIEEPPEPTTEDERPE